MNARYNIKKRRVPKFCQTILTDLNGNVVQSCDTIFLTHSFPTPNVVSWFDFMESVFPTVSSQSVSDNEICFTKIHAPCESLPGFYDFSFSKIRIEDSEYVLWYIYDYTNVYQELLDYQQKKNELDIQRQYFEYKNRRLSNISEIKSNSDFFLEHLQENNHSNYFMAYQQIVSSGNGLSNLLDSYGSYDKLNSLASGLNNSISKLCTEINTFLNGEKEDEKAIFNLEEIKLEIENKLREAQIRHKTQYKVNFKSGIKFLVKKNVLLHILYTLIINGNSLNANTQTSILFSIDESASQKMLKLTVLEDTDHNESGAFNIEELYTRLTFLITLIENNKGNIHTRYDEGSYTLTTLVSIPIKFL